MVILWITGGLGDIFFSWRCAYDFWKQNKVPILLVWDRSEHQESPDKKIFSRFFQPTSGFPKVVNVQGWKQQYAKKFMGYTIDLMITAYDSNSKWVYCEQCKERLNRMSMIHYRKSTVLIRTSFRGINFPNTEFSNEFFGMLKPSPRIERRIQDIVQRLGFDRPIGIHIRRTDSSWCIRDSPDILFIEKMKQILRENPDQKFFLCTDDAKLKNRLCEMFKGNVMTIDVKSRYVLGGLDDSVIELFLLSRCSRIYGCDSGFCVAASRIGGIPHEQLKLNV